MSLPEPEERPEPLQARRLRTYLTLLALPGVGRLGLERRLRERGEAWLDGGEEALGGDLKGALFPDPEGLALARAKAARQERAMEQWGIRCRFRGGPGWPGGLERLQDPPRLLFLRGQDLPGGAVALVGTRRPSAWGLREARRYARALARGGVAVLNGMAPGIDTAALEEVLDSGGKTVGVAASGHDALEGSPAGALARRMLDSGGSLVSEYAPGSPAHKGSFIERDRIQAALSRAVLVVESGPAGGTLHTARAALGAGVPLFALLSGETPAQARKDPDRPAWGQRGAWDLIRSGAAARVESPAGLMEAMGFGRG